MVHDGREWTYLDLHRRATRLAHALSAQGVGHGDRVAYLGPNHPALLESWFATGLLGAIFVPLNWRLATPELAHMLTDSQTRILIHAKFKIPKSFLFPWYRFRAPLPERF